jgi:hypothetical protein
MDKSEMYLEKWEGGHIRRDAKGRQVYVIRKQWFGIRQLQPLPGRITDALLVIKVEPTYRAFRNAVFG